MPEVNMRRIGLKVVLAAALTLFLVSSVRHQWNSVSQKQIRQMTSLDEADSNNRDKRNEEFKSLEDEQVTGNKTERVDTELGEDSLVKKVDYENIENVSAIESDRHKDDFGEETNVSVHDDESAYEAGINISNGAEIDRGGIHPTPKLLPFNDSTDNNSPHDAAAGDDDVPFYQDSDDHDPNWRSSKYADALYDDEEDGDTNKEDHLQVSDTDVKEDHNVDNYAQGAFLDLTLPGNTGTKETSMLSWLSLGKYLNFGNSPSVAGQDESQVYNTDKSLSDFKPTEGEINQISDLNARTNLLNENEGVNIGIDNKTITEIVNMSESEADTNQNLESNVQDYQYEAQNVQIKLTNKELPFDINGVDEANYNDFDDSSESDYQEPKEELSKTDHETENVQNDITNDTPLGVSSVDISDTAAQERVTGFRPWEQEGHGWHMGATQVQRPYGWNIPSGTQAYPQQIQPLLYQQQRPLLPQLTQRQQLFRAFLPPRIVDLILSEKIETSYLSRLPAKLQYYIQQNIHRIDQDLDPLTNSGTKYTAGGQEQFPVTTAFKRKEYLSPASSLISRENDETENQESFEAEEIDNSVTVEGDKYDSENNTYDGESYNNNGDSSNDGSVVEKDQDKIYTPSPFIANYDNPRPLSEKEFASFRTQPYNTMSIDTNHVSVSPADVNYSDDVGGIGLSKSRTWYEDETLSCPREIGLARMSHPVTALVAFSDDSTVWVRRMLEQLTGTETDSIYNIMAQLKAGNAANVYQMSNKIAIETHISSDKNFERAIVVIRNPFAVDAQHKTFRPSTVDWQKSVLWNQTYSTWLTSSLPLHVTTYEDMVERPLTELMKLTDFLSNPEMKISYKCAMKIALDPPNVIDDISQITGIYQDDRRRINQNIDYLIQVAQKTQPEIVYRLNSYKLFSSSNTYM